MKFLPAIYFKKQVARDKVAELKEQFTIMEADHQARRDKRRDAAVNLTIKECENEKIV